jgi:hypothetical protein
MLHCCGMIWLFAALQIAFNIFVAVSLNKPARRFKTEERANA